MYLSTHVSIRLHLFNILLNSAFLSSKLLDEFLEEVNLCIILYRELLTI